MVIVVGFGVASAGVVGHLDAEYSDVTRSPTVIDRELSDLSIAGSRKFSEAESAYQSALDSVSDDYKFDLASLESVTELAGKINESSASAVLVCVDLHEARLSRTASYPTCEPSDFTRMLLDFVTELSVPDQSLHVLELLPDLTSARSPGSKISAEYDDTVISRARSLEGRADAVFRADLTKAPQTAGTYDFDSGAFRRVAARIGELYSWADSSRERFERIEDLSDTGSVAIAHETAPLDYERKLLRTYPVLSRDARSSVTSVIQPEHLSAYVDTDETDRGLILVRAPPSAIDQVEGHEIRESLRNRTGLQRITVVRDGSSTLEEAQVLAVLPGGKIDTYVDRTTTAEGEVVHRLPTGLSPHDIEPGSDLGAFDLSGAYLRGVSLFDTDLSGASLRDIKLRGASLNGTTFADADINVAEFDEAYLQSADLSGAESAGAGFADADLNGADLTDGEFKHADFSDATLIGASLSGAHLPNATLDGADFTGTDLSGTDLSGASVVATTFSDADLSGADLSGVTLDRTEFTDATLAGVVFRACTDDSSKTDPCDFTGVDLSEADVTSSEFRGSDFTGADLESATLADSSFTNSDLSDATLSGAVLSDASFFRADLSGADLSESRCEGVNFASADLSGADLSGADLSNATLDGATLEGTDLTGADLSNCDCSEALFDAATLSRATLTSAELTDTDFRGVEAVETDFSRTRFVECHIESSDLVGANLSGADLTRARVESTDFSSADLSDANATRATLADLDLSTASLDGTRFTDSETTAVRFPEDHERSS